MPWSGYFESSLILLLNVSTTSKKSAMLLDNHLLQTFRSSARIVHQIGHSSFNETPRCGINLVQNSSRLRNEHCRPLGMIAGTVYHILHLSLFWWVSCPLMLHCSTHCSTHNDPYTFYFNISLDNTFSNPFRFFIYIILSFNFTRTQYILS